MKIYRGKYPSRIACVASYARGVVLIVLNDGGKYLVRASDNQGRMPQLGQDAALYVGSIYQPKGN